MTFPTLTIDAGTPWRRSAARFAASVLTAALSFSASLSAQPGSVTSTANPEGRPPSVRLVLEAGPETATCLSAAELVQAAEAQLGRAAFAEAGAPAETLVRVQLERTPDGFRARVALENAEEEPQPGAEALAARQLETREDCRALDEPLALVVALLADSGSEATARHAAAPPPEPPLPEPPADTGPISTAPRWEQAQRGPWTLVLDAAFVAAFGVMPDVAFGAELGAGFGPPGWPLLRARALGFLPGRAEVEPGGRVDFLLGMAGLGLCPELLAAAPVSLRACFGGDVIVRRAESHGLEGGQTTTRVTAQATLGLRGGFGLGHGWLGTPGIGAGLLSHIDRFSYRRNGAFELAFAPAFESRQPMACVRARRGEVQGRRQRHPAPDCSQRRHPAPDAAPERAREQPRRRDRHRQQHANLGTVHASQHLLARALEPARLRQRPPARPQGGSNLDRRRGPDAARSRLRRILGTLPKHRRRRSPAFWTHTEEDKQCGCQDECGDGLDNDCDCTADESDCVRCQPTEICGDGLDNDCDCIIDECNEEICGDGLDNDGDGAIEDANAACADPR